MYALSAVERGILHTILSCVSATGLVVPPMMIYPRKTSVPEKLKGGAFPNTLFKSSELNAALFVECFAFFLKSIPPAHPVLVDRDGTGQQCVFPFMFALPYYSHSSAVRHTVDYRRTAHIK